MKKIWIRALVLIAATVVGVIAKADEPAITSQPVPTAPANAATERRAAWDKAWQRFEQADRESLAPSPTRSRTLTAVLPARRQERPPVRRGHPRLVWQMAIHGRPGRPGW